MNFNSVDVFCFLMITGDIDSEQKSDKEDEQMGDTDGEQMSDSDGKRTGDADVEHTDDDIESEHTNVRPPLNGEEIGNLDTDIPIDLHEVRTMFDDLIRGEVGEESAFSDVLQKVNCAMKKGKESMKDLRTAQLWLQYMDMIDIMRTFIKSERTGDWKLH